MNLSAATIADNIIGVDAAFYPGKRIDLENPDESVILKKLRGDSSVREQMPRNGSPLSADQIAMIYGGELLVAGSPDAVRACADERVRRFIYAGSDEAHR